jgi:hypothetical protein
VSYVHTVDRRALVDSIYPLLGIAALPAATRLVVGESEHWQAVVAAACVLAAASLLSLRFHARVLQPQYAEIDLVERRRILASTAYNVVVYALTIGAVLILHAVDARPEIAFLLWFLLPLNQPASRWLADRRDT